MRNVLGLASFRSAVSSLKPILSPYQPPLPTTRRVSTLPSLSSRTRKEKKLSSSTIIDQVSPNISDIVDSSEIEQAEPLPTTKVTDTAALGQGKQELSPASPRKAPAFVTRRSDKGRGPAAGIKMKSYVEFITTPTSDTPGTALLLAFDDRRYIIGNAHEGLQRAGLQVAARLFRTKDLFLTGRTEWRCNGGLLGMIMCIADAQTASAASKAETARLKMANKNNRESEEDGKVKKTLNVRFDTKPSRTMLTPEKIQYIDEDPTVRLHGGPNLTHTVATARSFILRKGTPIKVLEHTEEKKVMDKAERDWEPTWSDHRVQVWAMPIKPSGVSEVDEDAKPESLRKRSLGEFMSGECRSEADILNNGSAQKGQDEQNQRIRESVVSEMFASTWSRDNLIEMPLRDVEMPATLFVRDPVTQELTKYEGPTPDGTAPVPDINVWIRKAWPGAQIDHLPPTKPSQTAMSYIIRNHRMRGKFMDAAAKKYKIPPGPLRAALVSGSSVQSSNGLTVTPDMVLGPSKEGSGVAVIDLPSTEYVHDLVNRPEWRAAKVMNGVVAVVWILGPGVVQDKSLIKFIEGQSRIQHIISSPEHCPNSLSMTSAATAAIRLHQIDPARYAVPVHSNSTSSTLGELLDGGETLSKATSKFCRPARRGLKILLEPKSGVSEEAVSPFLNTDLIAQETPQDVLDLSRAARQQINSPAVQAEKLGQNIRSPDAEIICLGTGSAMPSQHRNVAATLLRVPGCGSYLMDCGEGTLGQLKRMYTASQLAELFRDLKLIWISHLHADHHLGLASVVKAWYEEVHGTDEVKRPRPTITEQMLDPAKLLEDGKRLFIVGRERMMRWLEEYSSVEDFGFDQLVPLASIPINLSRDAGNLEWNGFNVGFNVSRDPRITKAIRRATGLSNLVSCAVAHCWGAQAVSLTFPTGFKFSYSGDCRPSKTFADIGKDSTVLLHEATFDDELKLEALAKKHSTTSEAIGVGVAMGARRVILTHFSQRYQKVPSMSALDPRSIRLEDAEDIGELWAGEDQQFNEQISPVRCRDSMDSFSDIGVPGQRPSAYPINALAQIIASNINPAPRPQLNDMKIGVAFDHMRVKVCDIMHLDKFTPALVQLYKSTLDEAKDDRAAKEAFSDDKNDILQKEQQHSVNNSEKRSQGKKNEKARKGEFPVTKKRDKTQETWAEEKRMENEKGKTGERAMDGVEVTEPVVEKMEAVQ